MTSKALHRFEPGWLTIPEVAKMLRLCRRRAYDLVTAHEGAVYDGTRWWLPEAGLAELRRRNTKRGRPWPKKEAV